MPAAQGADERPFVTSPAPAHDAVAAATAVLCDAARRLCDEAASASSCGTSLSGSAGASLEAKLGSLFRVASCMQPQLAQPEHSNGVQVG